MAMSEYTGRGRLVLTRLARVARTVTSGHRIRAQRSVREEPPMFSEFGGGTPTALIVIADSNSPASAFAQARVMFREFAR